jgi:hypothetical protein
MNATKSRRRTATKRRPAWDRVAPIGVRDRVDWGHGPTGLILQTQCFATFTHAEWEIVRDAPEFEAWHSVEVPGGVFALEGPRIVCGLPSEDSHPPTDDREFEPTSGSLPFVGFDGCQGGLPGMGPQRKPAGLRGWIKTLMAGVSAWRRQRARSQKCQGKN